MPSIRWVLINEIIYGSVLPVVSIDLMEELLLIMEPPRAMPAMNPTPPDFLPIMMVHCGLEQPRV